jgi:hypothetical protein
MQITCPRCARPIPGDDIDLALGRALCRPCGELFPLPAVGDGPLAHATASPLSRPLDRPHRPADLRWSERIEGKRAQFSLTPPRLAALPLLGFALLWNAFLVFWYTNAFTRPGAPSVLFWFPLLHVCAGAFVTWLALTRLLNSSRFTLDPDSFTLESGPVPQRGAREPASNVERFEVTSRISRGSTSWTLRMLTRDGRAVRLWLPISGEEHSRFVAERLNAALQAVREPAGYRE